MCECVKLGVHLNKGNQCTYIYTKYRICVSVMYVCARQCAHNHWCVCVLSQFALVCACMCASTELVLCGCVCVCVCVCLRACVPVLTKFCEH